MKRFEKRGREKFRETTDEEVQEKFNRKKERTATALDTNLERLRGNENEIQKRKKKKYREKRKKKARDLVLSWGKVSHNNNLCKRYRAGEGNDLLAILWLGLQLEGDCDLREGS